MTRLYVFTLWEDEPVESASRINHNLDPDPINDILAMSEPAPPVEAQQAAASKGTAAVPTDPAGPSKNALKKKTKEEEKARKAEERKRKEEEAKVAREAANAIVRGHLLQWLHSALTL